jgi:hypothetical protein
MAYKLVEDDDMGETWIRIRAPKSLNGIQASIRMRHWLKSGLRAYQLKVEQLTGKPPIEAGALTEAMTWTRPEQP